MESLHMLPVLKTRDARLENQRHHQKCLFWLLKTIETASYGSMKRHLRDETLQKKKIIFVA